MTQRSKREKDGTIKYVTLGGKARNQMSNVFKPRPTSKTDCKAMINVLLKNEKLCVTSIITNAASCDGYTKDMVLKLYAMNEVYRTLNPYSVGSNVGLSTVHATMEGSSKKVLSLHVVRGKGRPSTKRRMSMMEENVKKIKTKSAKSRNDKGKSKPRRRKLDTELLESNGNQINTSMMGTQETVQTSVMANQENVQQPMIQDSVQIPVMGTQESV
ncbi:uncharacterized protein LOC121249444 [Juglans microcarpa x Juglans regia]|uniref:uncharacterized protein LOC121249444 n=1 Tax=Juglans microcarpa x Juglans regia TaxID=2249226 RepID=UPI001B7DE530|nr:uncharacterized protein LOC121249444 [Juglans microcarpa x Juglans regia]